MLYSYRHRVIDRRGFTLIELLICVGIIGILASIIIVAINPSRQIRDARNAQRRSDVNTILNAVYQYLIDHEGNSPAPLTNEQKEICKTGIPASQCSGGIDLNILSGSYLASIPIDPTAPVSGTGTNYYLSRDNYGRVTIGAPNAELGITISR